MGVRKGYAPARLEASHHSFRGEIEPSRGREAGGVNRADKMRRVLRDGKPHSREEIQQREGFFLTNNAAAELRAQGCDVRKTQDGATIFYTLVAPLNETGRLSPEACPSSRPVSLSGAALAHPHHRDRGESLPGTDGVDDTGPHQALVDCEVEGQLPLIEVAA